MRLEDFQSTREWSKRYPNYTIVISHEKRDSINRYRTNDNWWTLSVYLYPEHPLFSRITSDTDLFESPINDMPLHKGCSLSRWHYSKGADIPDSKQIGCDYHHYQDDFYEEEDRLERTGVLDDAARLVEWLDSYAKKHGGGK